MTQTQVELLGAIFATFGAGVIRTSVGVGAGIFLTGSLSLLFGLHSALAVSAFLQIGFGLSALLHYWRCWEPRLALALIGSALSGVVLGSWLVTILSVNDLRRVFGIMILGIAVAEMCRPRRAATRAVVLDLGFGAAAGLAGSMANGAGAVLALYLRGLGLSYRAMIGTLSVVVFATDVTRLGLFWHFGLLSLGALTYALLFLPIIFAGGWAGTRLRDCVPEATLRASILLIIASVGVVLAI